MRNRFERTGSASVVSSASLSAPVSTNLTRRRFLLALGAGGAGAAAVATAPALAATEAATAAAAQSCTSGYRETEHIRNYYDTARI